MPLLEWIFRKTIAMVFGKMIAVNFDFLKYNIPYVWFLEGHMQMGLVFVKKGSD